MQNDVKTLLLLGLTATISYYTLQRYQEYSKRKSYFSFLKNHKNIKEISKMDFNSYELDILSNLVIPEKNFTTFDDIGGLDNIIQDLKDTIFFPLEASKLSFIGGNGHHSDIFSVPKGILLYGPPGTGKTMLARAIAHHCDYNFLTIDNSKLDSKWYGETEKMVSAMFSVAKKIQPTIIFIDEIDAMVSNRGEMEHEVSQSKKSLLLQFWDGFENSNNDRIIIMGATNRPNSIDPAFLRRLPKRIKVDLPDLNQRKHILQIILKPYVDNNNFNYDKLANLTKGYSGSDLKELCKNASMYFLRNKTKNDNKELTLGLKDFEKVLQQ
ncbi:hypothetical protein RB653_002643 [Dictyostelium firmibasis]|uniref:AAA+ ATPase domain-containing protein n=1 Tax=Dictyostelium firmibasis TaxID=79012 RepID=A0AAN7U9S0_9MYCE